MQLGWAIRRSAYFDSIALMRVAEQARQVPGVREVAVVMGTPGNRAMLLEAGMWPADAPVVEASDLLIVVQAAGEEAARLALARVAQLLDAGRAAATIAPEEQAPRTVAGAARAAGGANLALVVRRGAVGVVGASGTGIQEVTTLVHRLGAGVSHAIGTGGRDLDAAVGGVTTLQGLELLAADHDTAVIVIVSKPSSPAAAGGVLAAAATTGKPVVACLLGHQRAMPAGVQAAATLEEAAVAAVRLAGGRASAFPVPEGGAASPASGAVRGLFSGGTLCEEARRIVGDGPNRFVDFGAEKYTRGRPHPIVDPTRRHTAILEAAGEPDGAVLLLDVVIGDCAHPDPAGALRPVLGEARERARRAGRRLTVVAHVVGTEDDPQDLARQEATLRAAGAIVGASNRLAADTARRLAEGRRAG